MNRINIKTMMLGNLFSFMEERAIQLNGCGKYLLVFVLRQADGMDCTNNGVTSRFTMLYVPHPQGNYDLADLEEKADQIMMVIPPAIPGCPYRFRPYLSNGNRYMAGGNFIFSSDSRFAEEYGGPISVHDRVE